MCAAIGILESKTAFGFQKARAGAVLFQESTIKKHKSPGTPTTGLRKRGNDTSRSTGRSGRQNAATRRNMRREERVTVQGPVKKQPDGLSHRGAGGGGHPLSKNKSTTPRGGGIRATSKRFVCATLTLEHCLSAGHCPLTCGGSAPRSLWRHICLSRASLQ